jgi:hypothetical protein
MFSDSSFAVCGKTITSLRRNIITPMLPMLRSLGFTYEELVSKNMIIIKKDGRENYAKMHEETLRIFLLSEGEVPFVIMNHITVEHFDTKTNVWTKIQKDGFQVIQSGSGVYHGERITKDSRVFQIWFDPDFSKTLKEEPSYKDYPSDFIIPKKDNKRTIYEYIGDSKVEHKTSNIKITKEIFLAGTYNIQINKDYIYSIYTISGLGLINSKIVKDNDFIKCEDLEYLTIDAQNNLELFIVKTPKKLKYRTM